MIALLATFCLVVFCTALTAFVAARAWDYRPVRFFAGAVTMLVLLNLSSSLRTLIDDPWTAYLFVSASLVGLGLLCLALMLLVSSLFAPQWWQGNRPIRWIVLPYVAMVVVLLLEVVGATNWLIARLELDNQGVYRFVWAEPGRIVAETALNVGWIVQLLVMLVAFVREQRLRLVIGMLFVSLLFGLFWPIFIQIPVLVHFSSVLLTMPLMGALAYAVLWTRLLLPTRIALDQALQSMSEAVTVLDTNETVLFANPSAQALGIEPGRPLAALLPQPVPPIPPVEPPVPGRSARPPTTLATLAGRLIVLSRTPVVNRRNEVIGSLLLGRDVTAEEETLAVLRATLEATPDGIIALTQQGRVLSSNQHFGQLWGLPAGWNGSYCVQQLFGHMAGQVSDPDAFTGTVDMPGNGLEPESRNLVTLQTGQVLEHHSAPYGNGSSVAGRVWSFRDVTDRQRAEDLLRRRVRELNALRITMTEISSELQLDTLLAAILERAVALCDVTSGELGLYDPARHDLVIQANYGMDQDYRGRRQALSEGVLGRVARSREPFILDDYRSWEGGMPAYAALGIHAVLAVPLLAGEQLVGVLGVADAYAHRSFDPADQELLSLFAQQATIAIQNARLFEAARRQAEEAETLRRAGAAVAATLNQEESIDRVLEQLALVVAYDSASVQLRRDTETVIVGGRGFADMHTMLGQAFALDGDERAYTVYHERRPYHTNATTSSDRPASAPPQSRSWLGVPLSIHDDVIGMLTLDSTQPNHFGDAHLRLVLAFADQVAIALENARLFAEVQQLATTDPLTGLYNRRHFFTLAERACGQALRARHTLSVIMLDLDNFKRINDRYGHASGDHVLRTVAEVCRRVVRTTDIVGRYGGEEMVLLLPRTSDVDVEEAAERLRRTIAETPVMIEGAPLSITASLGVATCYGPCSGSPCPDNLLACMIDRADQALYMAKQRGKNRVESWSEALCVCTAL